MARQTTQNIVDMIRSKAIESTQKKSLTNIDTTNIKSADASISIGTIASITMYPIIPYFTEYLDTEKDIEYTSGEIGLTFYWKKHFINFTLNNKAKANPLFFIP